jgi:hypothetical protein
MYDIREELMHKMVRELRDQQSHFEIMSDEEFYNSDYGIRRRKNNQTCSKEIYMHCLVPGNAKNLLGVYFKKKFICIAAPMDFDNFVTSINVEKTQKNAFKKPYLKFKVERADLDDTYKDTVDLILGLLAFAKDNHLDQIW